MRSILASRERLGGPLLDRPQKVSFAMTTGYARFQEVSFIAIFDSSALIGLQPRRADE